VKNCEIFEKRTNNAKWTNFSPGDITDKIGKRPAAAAA